MNKTRKLVWCAFFIWLCCGSVAAKGAYPDEFINREQERISDLARIPELK